MNQYFFTKISVELKSSWGVFFEHIHTPTELTKVQVTQLNLVQAANLSHKIDARKVKQRVLAAKCLIRQK